MIFTINSEQGVDMFTKNNEHYLIYEWSRNPTSALFDYKVISDSISSNPSFICHNDIIHLYYIDRDGKLVHKKINRIQPQQNYLFNLAKNMNTFVDPICLIIDQQVYIFAVDQKNRLVQFVHGVEKYQAIETHCVGENVSQTSQLFLLQSQKCTKVVYRSEEKIKWVYVGKEMFKDKDIAIPLKINEACKLKIIQVKGSLKILFVSDENQVCCGSIDEQISKITEIEVISQRSKAVQGDFAVLLLQNKINIFYLNSNDEIAICTFQDEKWSSKKVSLQEQIRGGLFITQIYDKTCLMSFDPNQVTKSYEIVENQGSVQLVKRQSRPYLLWESIKDKLKPIGEEGYYADCFLLEDQNLVCKKYRTVHHAIRVKRQLDILAQLQKIEPHTFDHLLIEKGVLIGFTLPFIRGKMWDQYLDAQNNIFRRSPVARIKLVLKLWEIVRKIQQINLCHGDIHFQNIIIDLDEQQQDLLNPVFEVRLIDYGNAFMMTEGKLVTQGLTGWGPIVPPEAEFSYKRDYNPFGINAYQFARNSLFVLLLKPFKAISNTDYTPLRELGQLKKHEEYPSELLSIMKELVHYDIPRRIKALFEDHTALEEKTREIFIGSYKK